MSGVKLGEKKAWVRPELRKIEAGSAESGGASNKCEGSNCSNGIKS